MSGTLDVSVAPAGASTGFLAKERTIAAPGFNRWLVPPAALCIHLCIGMAYGFSVFWLPLSKALGISKPIDCPADMTFLATAFATACDWKVSTLGWMSQPGYEVGSLRGINRLCMRSSVPKAATAATV